MNLLCPNCQKMLTVPEQFAGQLMKCPFCSGTFTVPALPAGAPAAATPVQAVPEPAPATAPAPAPVPAPSPQEIYGVRTDGNPPATPAWSMSLAAEPPAAASSPAVSSPVAPDHVEPAALPAAPALPVAPAPEFATVTAPAPSTAPSTAPPEGYRHTRTIWFSPKVLPWVAPVCVVLIFILQFFTWVCVCPGGEEMIGANAWGATFNGGTSNMDLQRTPIVGKILTPESPNPIAGFSVLAIFYILPFVLVVLPVTVASIVLDRVGVKLPPAVQKVMPWRWGIVAALNLVFYLFLLLQMALGFAPETNYNNWVKSTYSVPDTAQTPEKLVNKATQGMAFEALRYGGALKLAVLLHLVAICSSALMFWVDRRGPNRPVPRLELMW
jgi:hypothetical protein